jgi:hypothetical protein
MQNNRIDEKTLLNHIFFGLKNRRKMRSAQRSLDRKQASYKDKCDKCRYLGLVRETAQCWQGPPGEGGGLIEVDLMTEVKKMTPYNSQNKILGCIVRICSTEVLAMIPAGRLLSTRTERPCRAQQGSHGTAHMHQATSLLEVTHSKTKMKFFLVRWGSSGNEQWLLASQVFHEVYYGSINKNPFRRSSRTRAKFGFNESTSSKTDAERRHFSLNVIYCALTGKREDEIGGEREKLVKKCQELLQSSTAAEAGKMLEQEGANLFECLNRRSSGCLNCDAKDHYLRNCPNPKNGDKIKANEKKLEENKQNLIRDMLAEAEAASLEEAGAEGAMTRKRDKTPQEELADNSFYRAISRLVGEPFDLQTKEEEKNKRRGELLRLATSKKIQPWTCPRCNSEVLRVRCGKCSSWKGGKCDWMKEDGEILDSRRLDPSCKIGMLLKELLYEFEFDWHKTPEANFKKIDSAIAQLASLGKKLYNDDMKNVMARLLWQFDNLVIFKEEVKNWKGAAGDDDDDDRTWDKFKTHFKRKLFHQELIALKALEKLQRNSKN